MTAGIESGSTDLDSIFAPWHSGWPQAGATGILSGSSDLNTRYARLSAGSAASATGIYSGSSDLNTIFAAAGTTGVRVATQPSAVSGVAAAGNPSGTVTSNTTTCAGAGGAESGYTYTWHIASGSATLTAPSSATCGVTMTVGAGTTDTGSMYCTISDGVTSANTTTVGWSLQNTTPAYLYSGSLTIGTVGFSVGYAAGGGEGSLTPTTVSGYSFEAIQSVTNTSSSFVEITSATSLGAGFFSSITINGTTYHTSSSIYSFGGGVSTWEWTATSFFTAGQTGTVPVVMQP